MSKERVSVHEGIVPVIVVAPHGYDDAHTGIIAMTIAKRLNCFAVVNNGWQRADEADWGNDKANCNKVSHCREDVVYDEFYLPLLRYISRSHVLCQAYSGFLRRAFMLTIHAANDSVKASAPVDIIMGTGKGDPPRPSCHITRKNAIGWCLTEKNIQICEGAVGSRFAAWDRDNLNQLWTYGTRTNIAGPQCLQLEIVKTPWRENPHRARATGVILASALQDIFKLQSLSKFDSDTFTWPEI